jgi:protoheme IX farnesyltransferase
MAFKHYKDYWALAKPGIIYGNGITALAASLFAAHWQIDVVLLFCTLLSLALVIAGSAVCNNYLDRDIDTLMERTKDRAYPRGLVGPRFLLVAALLVVLGLSMLFWLVNALAALIAGIGFIFYVGLYTPLKRWSSFATVVGSVAGATPVIVGYVSITNTFDAAALMLFLILASWQMPHFYAIAIRRLSDYKRANVPVLPAVMSHVSVKIHILIYILFYLLLLILFTALGYAGYAFLLVSLPLALFWFVLSIRGFLKR